ncbi:unnamed protein product [Ectocarpus sp. 4 AP-2014]
MVAIAPAKGARAPEKGSFPLDHGGECKPHMKAFLACLKKHDSDHLPCKSLSKLYLACRMDSNLMAREEFEKLGFSTEEEYERIRRQAPVKEGTKEGEGFVGGTHIRQRGGGWLSNWKKKD